MNNKPDGTPLYMVKNKPVPYWRSLYHELKRESKAGRYVKDTHKHTVAEIHEIISEKKQWCDDCGKTIELNLPENYNELASFVTKFINPNSCIICHDCEIKTIREGRVIGTDKEGWYPDKDKLLEKVMKEHEEKRNEQ